MWVIEMSKRRRIENLEIEVSLLKMNLDIHKALFEMISELNGVLIGNILKLKKRIEKLEKKVEGNENEM